jgi:hypothetical protein
MLCSCDAYVLRCFFKLERLADIKCNGPGDHGLIPVDITRYHVPIFRPGESETMYRDVYREYSSETRIRDVRSGNISSTTGNHFHIDFDSSWIGCMTHIVGSKLLLYGPSVAFHTSIILVGLISGIN